MRVKKRIIAIFVFFCVISVFILTALLEYNRAVTHEKIMLNDLLQVSKINIENLITSRMTGLNGLISYAEINSDFSQDEFSVFAKDIYETSENVIKNITYITDTTITHIYPYEENKGVIGTDLAKVESQQKLVLAAKETGNSVFAAPINLVQGGIGMVVRIPVIINSVYMGQAAIVFDYEKAIEKSGIDKFGELNYIELSGTDSYTGNKTVYWSNTEGELTNSIVQYIDLYDSKLKLAIYPKEGLNGRTTLFYHIIVIGILTAFLSYFAIYNLLRVKEDILYLAEHDPLTELYNRRKLITELENNLNTGKNGIIIILDIDNFKNINDTLGHVYGDKVLKYVSDLLSNTISSNASAYRLGGDEFLILMDDVIDLTILESRVKAIVDCFKTNNEIDYISNHITVSMGIVRYPMDGNNVEELLIKADISMYNAKKSGKNQYIFFDDYMMIDFDHKVQIEKEIKKAIDEDDFTLLYQPIVDTETGEVSYFEALIRMSDSSISPGVFIPIAEECGFIIPIGRWVIKESIKQLKQWRDKGFALKPIAVNLSPKQIHDSELIDFLSDQLVQNELEASLIEIEITENVLLANKEENIKTLMEIKKLGINITLDDFGTGYSSFNYLTYLPVNKIKLDKSLKDKFIFMKNRQVMDGVILIAHGLNLKVVAEGIEEEQEYEILKTFGCDYLQGYLFSKPVCAEEIENIFNKNYIR